MRPCSAIAIGLLAALCVAQAQLTHIGYDEVPSTYDGFEFSISGDGKKVGVWDYASGALEVFTRGSMNKSAPLVSWEKPFPGDFEKYVWWRLNEDGTKVAATGTASNQTGKVAMVLYDLSTSPPKALWKATAPIAQAGDSVENWNPHFPPGQLSVVFGASVYQRARKHRRQLSRAFDGAQHYTSLRGMEEGNKRMGVDHDGVSIQRGAYRRKLNDGYYEWARHKSAWVQRRALADGVVQGSATVTLDSNQRLKCLTAALSKDGSAAAVGDAMGKVWLVTGLGAAAQKVQQANISSGDDACPHFVLSKTGKNVAVLWKNKAISLENYAHAYVYRTGSLALRANVTDPCGTSVRGRMKISYLSSVYFSGEDEPRYLTCLNEDKPSGEKVNATFVTTTDLSISPPKKVAAFPTGQEWVNACATPDWWSGDCSTKDISTTGKQVWGYITWVDPDDNQSVYEDGIDWWALP